MPMVRFFLIIFISAMVIHESGKSEGELKRFNEFNMQPEVWHFLAPPQGAVDGKGDLHLQIPVMKVPGTLGLDFEISFSYKAGILYHQTASWVGLGWNFDPGSITRDVQGNARIDDGSGGQINFIVDDNSDPSSFRYMPDDYYVSLPGQGTFRMSRSNSLNFNRYGQSSYLHPYNGDYGFYPEEYRPVKIFPTFNQNYSFPGGYFSGNEITRFSIITEDGYRYIFGLPSLAIYISYVGTMPYQYHPNAWRLLAIAGPDYAGDIEDLIQGCDYNINNLGPSHAYSILENFTDWIKFEYCFDDNEVFCDGHAGDSRVLQHTYLRWIITPTHFARFFTGNRGDIDLNINPIYPTATYYKKLIRIDLNTKSAQLVKTVEILQDSTLGQSYYLNPEGDKNGKLTLKEIKFRSYDGKYIPGYAFQYVDLNPAWSTLSDDFFYDGYGYYNEAPTPRMGIDRDTSDAQAWSLKTVTYPTGGSESYQYENDYIWDATLNYFFKPSIYNVEEHSFDFNSWAGQYACHRQGGVRVAEIVRRNGMGDSLVIQYDYGPGHVPAVPYNLFPWMDLGMTISTNEFHVYKRGEMDVVYEWVNKIFDLTNSEKTFYEIAQDYHSAFPHLSKMKTVLYESPLNTHWMFYNDNSHLFWGIPWDRPRRIERRRNTHLEITELDYESGNRKLNIFSPEGSPFGSEFSLRQIWPAIKEEVHSISDQAHMPLIWPYQKILTRKQYSDTTKQLKSITTYTADRIKKEEILYAHEVLDYGGGSWDPGQLSGMRAAHFLTSRARLDQYESDRLDPDSLQNCPALSGDSQQVFVSAMKQGDGQDYEMATFSVPFIQSVRWECVLDINAVGEPGWGQARFRISENNSDIVNKLISGNIPPDRNAVYSGTFTAYPGKSYTVVAKVLADKVKSGANGKVKYIINQPVDFSLVKSKIWTYDLEPVWDGGMGTNNDRIWKLNQVYNLNTSSPLCSPPNFSNWSQQGSFDSRWQRSTKVLKYRYGKAVRYADGNNNVLRIFYGDNTNNLDSSEVTNNFAREYVTAIQLDEQWIRQFDYNTRFLQVNRISDENGNSQFFRFDPFSRLSAILNTDMDTVSTHQYAYSAEWSPTGVFHKNCPNYISQRQFFSDNEISERFDYYDGRGNKIQSVVQDSAGQNFYNYHTAFTYDNYDREEKNYRTYIRNSFPQPGYDKYFATYSSGFTQFDYHNAFESKVKKIEFPDQQAKNFTYSFIKAEQILPALFTAADSVVWLKNTTIDENGNKVNQYLDESERMVLEEREISASHSLKTFFRYDALDQIEKVYPPIYFEPPTTGNPENYIIEYYFNSLGQQYQKNSLDEGQIDYHYDLNGNLRFKRDVKQDSSDTFIYYKYDALNRITEEGIWPDGSDFDDPVNFQDTEWPAESEHCWKVRHFYDIDYINAGLNYCIGRLTKTENRASHDAEPEMIIKYKYNRLGWMTEKRIKISGLAEKVINFFHDRQGNLSRIVYPSGTVVDNRYNNRGLLKTISTVSGGGDIPNEE